eukprot:224345_1
MVFVVFNIVPFCIICVMVLGVLYRRYKFQSLNMVDKERLERRWVQTDIEMQFQSVRRITSRISMQEQIRDATSLRQLMPFIERIDIDDLKKILVAHYDGANTEDEHVALLSDDEDGRTCTRVTTQYSGEEDAFVEAGDIKTLPNTALMDDIDPFVVDNNQDDAKTTKTTIQMPENEQQELVELYGTNRKMWRNKITTTIREHPHQFQIVLEIFNNNNDDEKDNDASLTMEKLQNAFPALSDTLIECMFEDIASFDAELNDENTHKDANKSLKITTVVRWMHSKPHLRILKEVGVVNDEHIIVLLYHKLDKYLEYKSGHNGKGVMVERMK